MAFPNRIEAALCYKALAYSAPSPLIQLPHLHVLRLCCMAGHARLTHSCASKHSEPDIAQKYLRVLPSVHISRPAYSRCRRRVIDGSYILYFSRLYPTHGSSYASADLRLSWSTGDNAIRQGSLVLVRVVGLRNGYDLYLHP